MASLGFNTLNAGQSVQTPQAGNGSWVDQHPWAAPLLPAIALLGTAASPEIAAAGAALTSSTANRIGATGATVGGGVAGNYVGHTLANQVNNPSYSATPNHGQVPFAPANGTGAAPSSNSLSGSGNNGTSTGGIIGPSATPAQLQLIQSGLNNIWDYGRSAFGSAGGQYQAYAAPAIQNLSQQQAGINAQREGAAFQNAQSMLAIQQALRNGLQSGAIQIAGLGGTASSASYDLARLMGQNAAAQKESQMQNLAETNRQLDLQQGTLNTGVSNELAALGAYRDQLVNTVQQDVNGRLASLEQMAAMWGAPAPDESQKSQIINDGISKLAAIDQWIQQQMGGIQGEGNSQAAQNAYTTMQKGGTYQNLPAPTQFSFQPNVQNMPTDSTGAPITNLPLFLSGKNQSQII